MYRSSLCETFKDFLAGIFLGLARLHLGVRLLECNTEFGYCRAT